MSTNDIDNAVATLRAAGGTLFTPPTDLADRGRIAVVTDPQGALFALLETKDGDPVDREPQIDGFLWNEVWAADVEAATRFYQNLVGLEAVTEPMDNGGDYFYLADDGTPRFGVLPKPVEDVVPFWATYFRVRDPAAIVARVEELGGRVLLGVQDRPIGGQVALIADSSGAGIAIQTWEPKQRQARLNR